MWNNVARNLDVNSTAYPFVKKNEIQYHNIKQTKTNVSENFS